MATVIQHFNINKCYFFRVAIGVGTTFGALVMLIIAGGVFICCIQRRYSPKEEVKFTKDGFTQYEKSKLYVTYQCQKIQINQNLLLAYKQFSSVMR